MTSVGLHGSWRITVTRKDSHWAQRIVVSGSTNGVIPGVVGSSATVSGDSWDLTIEHDYGGGWQPSAYVQADPVREHAGHATRTIMSKDHYWRGDSDPNDLVLRLEHVGGELAVIGTPSVENDDRFLAVTVRNTGFRPFGYDSVFDVTDAGRDTLARWGVELAETWDPAALRATGQEAFGRAVGVRPLNAGDQDVLRFPLLDVRTAGHAPEAAEIEFTLSCDGRTSRVRHVVRAADLRPAQAPMISGELCRAPEPVAPSLPVNLLRARTAPPACPPAAGSRAATKAPGSSTRAPGSSAAATASGQV